MYSVWIGYQKSLKDITSNMQINGNHLNLWFLKSKIRAIPEGSRRLRLPDYEAIGTWKWQGCQPYAPAIFTTPLPPRNIIPDTYFC